MGSIPTADQSVIGFTFQVWYIFHHHLRHFILQVPIKTLMIMFFKSLILSYLFFATSKLSYSDAKTSIVMTMICRDEEVNLRANLAQWFPVIDYFIFLIDSRNTDHTWYFIKRTFQGSKANSFKALSYDFEGFGHARTLV